MKKILLWAASALALSLPVSTRQAQALELKVADSFPAGHYLVRLMLKPWMDDVTKRTKLLQDEGVSFDPFSEATRAEMKDKLKDVGQEWAARLDGRGKPASAALKEFEGLLASGGK